MTKITKYLTSSQTSNKMLADCNNTVSKCQEFEFFNTPTAHVIVDDRPKVYRVDTISITQIPNLTFTAFNTTAISYGFAQPISTSEVWDIILMSNKMFEGTKPMEGRDLYILKKSYRKGLSKTPTSLHK